MNVRSIFIGFILATCTGCGGDPFSAAPSALELAKENDSGIFSEVDAGIDRRIDGQTDAIETSNRIDSGSAQRDSESPESSVVIEGGKDSESPIDSGLERETGPCNLWCIVTTPASCVSQWENTLSFTCNGQCVEGNNCMIVSQAYAGCVGKMTCE